MPPRHELSYRMMWRVKRRVVSTNIVDRSYTCLSSQVLTRHGDPSPTISGRELIFTICEDNHIVAQAILHRCSFRMFVVHMDGLMLP